MGPLQAQQFLMIVKHMNLTKAASELYISQSALSQSLARLENELGVRLFYRDGSRLILSPEGNALLEPFQTFVAAHDALIDQAHALSERQHESLRIGYSGSVLRFAALHMSEFLSTDEEHHTEISTLYADRNVLQEMLLQGQIDFTITYPPLKHERISGLSLSKERIVLAVPSEHPLAAYKRVSAKNLKDAEFVGSQTGSHFRTLVDELCAQCGLKPHYVKEVGYKEIYRLTDENRGKGNWLFFCPEDVFQESYGDGYRMVRFDEKSMSMVTAISWLTERNLNLQYKDLIDQLTANFGSQETFHAQFTGVLARSYKADT